MAKGIAQIKITSKGKNPIQFLKEINGKIHFEFQEELVKTCEATAELMRQTIKDSIKRPGSTGKLENSIQSEVLDSTGGIKIGIGKISELPIYWEVLNNGGYVPPANLGYFGDNNSPKAGASGEQWTHTGKSSDFLMKPKKPIEPVRYVEISEEQLTKHIEKEIKKFLREETQASK